MSRWPFLYVKSARVWIGLMVNCRPPPEAWPDHFEIGVGKAGVFQDANRIGIAAEGDETAVVVCNAGSPDGAW